jgi:hypothetical protein
MRLRRVMYVWGLWILAPRVAAYNTRGVYLYQIWCVYFVQTCKAKYGFGYVESNEIIEVTPTRQICEQTQWKVLSIKSDISVNVDVFNQRFVTQFPKLAVDYEVDLSRYCTTGKFYFDLRCFETFLVVFKIHISFMLDRNLQTVSFSMLGHLIVRVITCFGVIL